MDMKLNSHSLVLQVILSLVSVYILLQIYGYLNDLDSCPCFQIQDYENYKTDLEFMKFYQLLEIFMVIIFFVVILMYKFNKSALSGKNNDKSNRTFLLFLMVLVTLVMVYITGYMSYNSLNFYLNVKEDCKCANKWQKWFVYVQGIMNTINFSRLIFAILMIVILIIFNYMK